MGDLYTMTYVYYWPATNIVDLELFSPDPGTDPDLGPTSGPSNQAN
jgi:hypothetical protein